MLKENKRTLIITTVLMLLPVLAGILLWNRLSDPMPIHWNAAFEADGWAPRWVGVFVLPLSMLLVQGICVLSFHLDDKLHPGKNAKILRLVLWLIPVVSAVTCSVTLAAGMGLAVNMRLFLPLLMGPLFILLGNYLPKCSRNAVIGIKIPTTLNDEDNWNRTHRMAGFLWTAGGFVILLTAFFPSVWLTLAILLVMAVLPILYSVLLALRTKK